MSHTVDSDFAVFFFNDTATTEIYTLSLHDALPIFAAWQRCEIWSLRFGVSCQTARWFSRRSATPGILDILSRSRGARQDRKSTRLNSSHGYISYAVFCLKKKKNDYHHSSSHHHEFI